MGGSASSDAGLFHSGCGFSHGLKSYGGGFLQLDLAGSGFNFFPFWLGFPFCRLSFKFLFFLFDLILASIVYFSIFTLGPPIWEVKFLK